ncbi:MAG: hypothetical protein WED33_00340 [Bacteroidia bacterium]
MSKLSDEVSELEAKIKKLIHLHVALQKDCINTKSDNELLKTTIHKQQEQIRQLEEGNKALQLAKALMTNGENTDSAAMKSKINEVIKDIDSCLALLNK